MAGLFVPLDTLRREETFGGEAGTAHSYQAASLLQFVDRVYGRNKLRALWSSGVGDSRKVLGISPDSLELKWRGRLSNVTPKMSWTKWWTRVKARGCA
jgi:hypothetical protein